MTRYYKIIDGEKVYFPGYIVDGGVVWTRPSEERILADGWIAEEYEPPTPEPIHPTEPDERRTFEAMRKLLASQTDDLSDEEALEVEECFPTWESLIGKTVESGKRVWDDGHLWRVLQTHTEQTDWRPGDTPSLYTRVSIEEWPEWVQPTGAHDAYMTGDKVTHNGKRWESEIDYNVYEPGVYGWKEV